MEWMVLTLHVGSLLLPEQCADIAYSGGEGDLEVLGHGLLASAGGSLALSVFEHDVYASDGLLTGLETPGDFAGQGLNLVLLSLLDMIVVEAGQDVFLVQLLQLLHLPRDGIEPFGDLILDVEPARR